MDVLPTLSASQPTAWGVHFGGSMACNPDVALSVIEGSDWVCSVCGLKSGQHDAHPMGFLEIHHRDGDHENTSPENLRAVCPLCHEAMDSGVGGYTGTARVTPIWLPELSQLALNKLCVGLFMRVAKGGDDSSKAYDIYDQLAGQADSLVSRLGLAATDTNAVAVALSVMPLNDDRRKFLTGIRLLPVLDAFSDASRFWATIRNEVEKH